MWSNWSATWEFSPAALGLAASTWPTSFDPLGISVPSGVFADALVCTTTLSPVLAVFESSLLTSSPLIGLISITGASGLAAGLFCGSAPGGFCRVAGLFGWLAGGGCWAKRGKLAKVNRVVTSVVAVFMKYPPLVPHSRIRRSAARSRGSRYFASVVPNRARPGSPRRLSQRIDLETIDVGQRGIGVIPN